LGVYGHYKWLYNAWTKAKAAGGPVIKGQKKPPIPVSPQYDGNVDSDSWQAWETTGANLQQLEFMMGLPITQAASAMPPPAKVVPKQVTPAKSRKKSTAVYRPQKRTATKKKASGKKAASRKSRPRRAK
jgi:hypothetical protein